MNNIAVFTHHDKIGTHKAHNKCLVSPKKSMNKKCRFTVFHFTKKFVLIKF